jgi:hypothetical protein
LDLKLPMQSVPKDVSLNPAHREAYSYSMQCDKVHQ